MGQRPSRITILFALFGSAVLVASGGSVAGAASTAKGPLALTVGVAPYFDVGAAGGHYAGGEVPADNDFSTATAQLYIHATSSSRITEYETAALYDEGSAKPTVYKTSPNPLTWTVDNYDGSEGGGAFSQTGWKVTVKDSAGHSVTKNECYFFDLIRWDNSDAEQGETLAGTWSFSPGWSTSTCACADGGSMAKTATANASATYTDYSYDSGEHFGLMMATGPTRGEAAIYVNGSYATTIDTNASSNQNRIYVWDSGPLKKGTNTVQVVNLATSGSPYLFINAMGEIHNDPF